jgi:hypothetical protein
MRTFAHIKKSPGAMRLAAGGSGFRKIRVNDVFHNNSEVDAQAI